MSEKHREPAPCIVFLITEDWYFWTHRLPLARAAQQAGFNVVIATCIQEHGKHIAAEGLRAVPIRLRRSSRNPLREIASIVDLVRLYRRERPVLVHHVAVKPVLYGSIAAWITRVPAVVNAVAGLGHVFVARGWQARLMKVGIRLGYKAALSACSSRVIFQTESDRLEMVSLGIVPVDRAVVIRGAGVNTREFTPAPEPAARPIIMFAGRLLWNKGVGDLVDAGKLLARDGHAFTIVLVGIPDFDNPLAVSEDQLRNWAREGRAEWWGKRDDMAAVLREAAIVTLPSFYGEGVPKILLEAAACGRPIVASDLPGCRDAVRDGETGFIVPARRPEALAQALAQLLDDPLLRTEMGARGRALVLLEFSEEAVVAQTLDVYRSALANKERGAQAIRLL